MKREIPIAAHFHAHQVAADAERIATRAAKKGLLGGWTVTLETRYEMRNGINVEQPYLILEGEPARYNGWRYLATAEWINGALLLTARNDDDAEAGRGYKPTEGRCDHCHQKRARSRIVLVQHEDGAIRQVGTTCLKDFLGHEIGTGWHSPTDPLDELEQYAGVGQPAYRVRHILTLALAVTGLMKGYRNVHLPPSTADMVRTALRYRAGVRDAQMFDETVAPPATFAARCAEAEANVPALIDLIRGLSPGPWADNLKALVSDGPDGWVADRHLNLLISASAAWVREQEKAAAAAAAPTVTEARYAENKTRIEMPEATITAVRGFDTQWGFTNVYVWLHDGHRFEWLTSVDLPLEVGDTVAIKGTVKGVNEFNGQISTVMTRCKVLP